VARLRSCEAIGARARGREPPVWGGFVAATSSPQAVTACTQVVAGRRDITTPGGLWWVFLEIGINSSEMHEDCKIICEMHRDCDFKILVNLDDMRWDEKG
jgi:hypothetical protein